MSAAADALMGIFGFKRVEGGGMKTDRELLELAAKAAGLEIGHWCSFFGAEFAVTQSHSELNSWNPLECDANALQLAVALKLDIQFFDGYAEIHCGGDGITSAAVEPYAKNMQAATRRAIVRAAAAIGEGME